MTLMLNRYGPMQRPEEQKHIEVAENPLEIVRGTYNLWLQIAQKIYPKKGGDDFNSFIYREAVNLLQPYAKIFANVKPTGLESILSKIKDEDTGDSGLYISALLNATDLPELDGVFNHKNLGYHLAPGKTLIVREGSQIDSLGFHGKGTLINFGEASIMAPIAEDGVQVNYGFVRLMFASLIKFGVQINFGTFDDARKRKGYGFMGGMGFGACGGVQLNYGYGSILAFDGYEGMQINFGDVESMSIKVSGALGINYGRVRDIMNGGVSGGTQINIGETNRFHSSKKGVQHNLGIVRNGIFTNKSFMKRNHPLFKTLEERLNEIDYIKQLNGSSEAITLIKQYDWKKFEEEVLELGKQIEEALK